MEIIEKIIDNDNGYKVITNKQEISLYIDTSTSCCEVAGYLMSEDSFVDFLGAELISIEVVDSLLKVEMLEQMPQYEAYTMFINLNTSKGVLQFVAYNSHNGYYGHQASVTSNQLKYDTVL